ncbi:MAG TPA: hypothetical protein ENI27_04900 [bacterium]|nr:hypothetical protein [bacterium]
MTGPDKNALTPEVVEPEDEFIPIVEGKRITPKQIETFKLWREGMKYAEISRRMGLGPHYMHHAVYKSAWFRELRERVQNDADQRFMMGIYDQDDITLKARREIIKGQRADDKSVMGQVRLIEQRKMMGDKPIINKRGSAINIQQNISGGSGTINLGALKTMTQEELLEMNESGVIPDRITEGNG